MTGERTDDTFAERVKSCSIVVQDGDLWLELPDGGMSVQLTKGKAWTDPDAPKAEAPALKHHVVMCNRYPSTPAGLADSRYPNVPAIPVAVFLDVQAAANWIAKSLVKRATNNETYGGLPITYYIETVETYP